MGAKHVLVKVRHNAYGSVTSGTVEWGRSLAKVLGIVPGVTYRTADGRRMRVLNVGVRWDGRVVATVTPDAHVPCRGRQQRRKVSVVTIQGLMGAAKR